MCSCMFECDLCMCMCVHSFGASMSVSCRCVVRWNVITMTRNGNNKTKSERHSPYCVCARDIVSSMDRHTYICIQYKWTLKRIRFLFGIIAWMSVCACVCVCVYFCCYCCCRFIVTTVCICVHIWSYALLLSLTIVQSSRVHFSYIQFPILCIEFIERWVFVRTRRICVVVKTKQKDEKYLSKCV